MIALVQRVRNASVTVDEESVARIGSGLLILVGIHREDSEKEMAWIARKCVNLRVFPDDNGTMNRSVLDTDGEVLLVSQFTLYGDIAKGNRPSYNAAAPPDIARPRFDRLVDMVGALIRKPVRTGIFGAMMQVALTNDGPVTIWIEKSPASTK